MIVIPDGSTPFSFEPPDDQRSALRGEGAAYSHVIGFREGIRGRTVPHISDAAQLPKRYNQRRAIQNVGQIHVAAAIP
jgi:hypothetical protein